MAQTDSPFRDENLATRDLPPLLASEKPWNLQLTDGEYLLSNLSSDNVTHGQRAAMVRILCVEHTISPFRVD